MAVWSARELHRVDDRHIIAYSVFVDVLAI